MKFSRLIVFLAIMISAGFVYPQSQDLKDMFKQMTGKDLDLDKELGSIKGDRKAKNIFNEKEDMGIDTIPEVLSDEDLVENDDFIVPLSGDSLEPALTIADTGTYFEKYANGAVIDPYTTELKQFQIDFSSVKTNLNYNKKVPDNYMLATGDLLVIDIWGAINENYEVEMTNEGFIVIPDIGKIDISGLDYKNVKKVIGNYLGKINGINYVVRIADVKPISVFVMGKVNKPGVYNVSPFTSMIEVLTLAGGVTAEGSLRNIKLISETGKERFVDLYSLLFYGEKDGFILGSGETVFVPLIDKQVAVAGNVKNEGIFELKKGENLKDLLEIAGLTPFSETSRIEVERLNEKGRAFVKSVDLKENPNMKDGDIVRVFSTLVYNSDYVYLKGNFRHNRKMQYRNKMNLGDIISSDEILKDNTNMNYGHLIRKRSSGKRDVIINFSPLNVLEKRGDEAIEVSSRDTVVVFSLDSINFQRTVKIDGEVKYPGEFNYTEEMTVKNLLNYAGGVSEFGDENSVVVIRNRGQASDGYFTDINPESFVLKESDSVFVYDYRAQNPEEFVSIFGEVKNPAIYLFKKNMTVKDLLLLSGGFTAEARIDSVEVASGINRDNKTLQVKSYSFKESGKIKLKPNDNVFVRKVKNYGKVKFVTINGEVKYPGVYALRDNEEFSDLLKRCGGFTDNAAVKATRIFRKSVEKRQQEKIRKLKSELDTKLKVRSLVSGDNNLIKLLNVDTFDSLKASGRVVVDIDKYGLKRNFAFENKDSIFVPSRSKTVIVMGEVYQETAISYDPEETEVEHYLEMAGGVTAMGSEDNVYVIKANGELVRKTGWFSSTLDYDLEEGDMVFVPFDYEKMDYIGVTKDITSILAQLSMTAYQMHEITKD